MFEKIREIENESNLSCFEPVVDLSSLLMGRVVVELSYGEMEPLWLILFVYIDRRHSECLRSCTGFERPLVNFENYHQGSIAHTSIKQ